MIDPMDQFWDLVRTQAQIANQDLEDRLAKFLVTVPVDQWYRVRMDSSDRNPLLRWPVLLPENEVENPNPRSFLWLEDLPSGLSDGLVGEYVEIESGEGDFAAGFVWRIGWEPGTTNLMLVLDWGWGIALSAITSIQRTDGGV